jgi:endo-1,4-beta-xylanase
LFVVASHEGVGGILMWGFWDQAHWRPNAAIVNGDNLVPNAAGAAYIKLYHETFRFNILAKLFFYYLRKFKRLTS